MGKIGLLRRAWRGIRKIRLPRWLGGSRKTSRFGRMIDKLSTSKAGRLLSKIVKKGKGLAISAGSALKRLASRSRLARFFSLTRFKRWMRLGRVTFRRRMMRIFKTPKHTALDKVFKISMIAWAASDVYEILEGLLDGELTDEDKELIMKSDEAGVLKSLIDYTVASNLIFSDSPAVYRLSTTGYHDMLSNVLLEALRDSRFFSDSPSKVEDIVEDLPPNVILYFCTLLTNLLSRICDVSDQDEFLRYFVVRGMLDSDKCVAPTQIAYDCYSDNRVKDNLYGASSAALEVFKAVYDKLQEDAIDDFTKFFFAKDVNEIDEDDDLRAHFAVNFVVNEPNEVLIEKYGDLDDDALIDGDDDELDKKKILDHIASKITTAERYSQLYSSIQKGAFKSNTLGYTIGDR